MSERTYGGLTLTALLDHARAYPGWHVWRAVTDLIAEVERLQSQVARAREIVKDDIQHEVYCPARRDDEHCITADSMEDGKCDCYGGLLYRTREVLSE